MGPTWTIRASILALLMGLPGVAGAVDAVTGASKREQRAGTPNAAVWIVGRGFQPGLRVVISGGGIVETRAPTVVAEADRIDGGRGDGVAYYFSIAPDAVLGVRDITVTGADGSSVTGRALIEIVEGLPEPDPEPDPNPDPDPDPGPDPDPPDDQRQPGKVEFVSRASPAYAEQGAQVNLWIVGRSFVPGLEVAFSTPGLGPAQVDGRVIEHEVVRNAPSAGAGADGIQYFLQVPAEAPTGPVNITVTNPNGTNATGLRLFEIVPPGEIPVPEPGTGDVDGITGASPAAARAGRNVSLWIWGEGFATGARVLFSSNALRPYAEPEVVEHSTSNEGYAGIRAFLFVEDGALPGPVDITVTNPNGTTAVAQGLFEIVGANGAPGTPGGGAVEDTGPCPDVLTSIEALTAVSPPAVGRGQTVNLAIQGRAFGCGASVVISGGGLRATDAPRLIRDAADPLRTTLFWQVEVLPDAAPGARDVTVINPNNTSKTLRGAFRVGEGDVAAGGGKSGAFCQAAPGAGGGLPWVLLPLCLLALRRRR